MVRREIYALDYGIVELVSGLDSLFHFAVDPEALKIAGGLNVEMNGNMFPDDTQVWIHPVSWPDGSGISARFQKVGGEWKAFEGSLLALHLTEEFARFTFECTWDYAGHYRFRGRGTTDEKVLDRLLAARAATEIKLK